MVKRDQGTPQEYDVQDAQVSCVHGRTGTTFLTLFANNVQGAIVANYF